MTTSVRLWIAGATLAALLGLMYTSGSSAAVLQNKDMKASVNKIAEAWKKGDKADAKKLAEATASDAKLVEEIGDVMHMFTRRDKKGLGVGSKALDNPAKDGIEIMIRDLAKNIPGGFAKQAAAYEEMGYHIAAIGEITKAAVSKAPVGAGKKTKANWIEMSEQMRDAGIELGKAAAGKNADAISKAARKVNDNCSKCHTIFKE